MEETIKLLNGITYGEWQKIKLVVDNSFEDLKRISVFNATEDTFKELKSIM